MSIFSQYLLRKTKFSGEHFTIQKLNYIFNNINWKQAISKALDGF